MEFQQILVAVKGDQADVGAIKLACLMAQKSGAKVYAVYIIEVKRSLPLDAALDSDVEVGEAILHRAADYAESMDYDVETELLKAREVGPALVEVAIEKGVDLILMSMGYKKRFGQFNLGRAVPYVLQNAPCRVILSREPLVPDKAGGG